ncbi:MAG: CvpA family protein, partial [Oxalobacter sp.]|nr:CvpA family protein [Oxalobacter sp.]
MTAFDYALLVLLIGSMLISLTRGLVREVISLASWILAFYVAINYSEMFSPWLAGMISGETARIIVAFVVLFLATRIVMI